MSVYYKENPSWFNHAMQSIWSDQILKPAQIVLVQDGPLTPELVNVVEAWSLKLGSELCAVPLLKNVGLAAALNEGLKHCKYEMVARMDTDDIAMPDRFEKQFTFMQNNPKVAVCSGLIEEWSQDFSHKISERRLPLTHQEIIKFAQSRNPISHPTAMFRKSGVLEVGGYPEIYPEDYALWGLMLAKGYMFANLPDLLLKMRVGNALTERRGGSFLKGEIKVFKYLHVVGFLSTYVMYRNILQRSIVRLSPVWLKKAFYKYLR